MSSVVGTWRKIESWLAAHWPQGLEDLRPPATDEEIHALERALGAHLPSDFSDALRVHNGQQGLAGCLFPSGQFLGSEDILDHWMCWKTLLDSGHFQGLRSDSEDGVLSDWWSPGWIPVTHNGFGDHDCIDLTPTASGMFGQLITMWHDQPERTVLAPSYSFWLAQFHERLQSELIVFCPDSNCLVERDLLR